MLQRQRRGLQHRRVIARRRQNHPLERGNAGNSLITASGQQLGAGEQTGCLRIFQNVGHLAWM
jgi:hypothetical protein